MSDVPFLDLTSITQPGLFTKVEISDDHFGSRVKPWMYLRQTRLRPMGGGDCERWRFSAFLTDATDNEHDSAYAMTISLVGLRFLYADYVVVWAGFVEPTTAAYCRVPPVGYNPAADPKARVCDRCDEKHVVVPYYQPPVDLELFQLVRGRLVRIYMAPHEMSGA